MRFSNGKPGPFSSVFGEKRGLSVEQDPEMVISSLSLSSSSEYANILYRIFGLIEWMLNQENKNPSQPFITNVAHAADYCPYYANLPSEEKARLVEADLTYLAVREVCFRSGEVYHIDVDGKWLGGSFGQDFADWRKSGCPTADMIS